MESQHRITRVSTESPVYRIPVRAVAHRSIRPAHSCTCPRQQRSLARTRRFALCVILPTSLRSPDVAACMHTLSWERPRGRRDTTSKNRIGKEIRVSPCYVSMRRTYWGWWICVQFIRLISLKWVWDWFFLIWPCGLDNKWPWRYMSVGIWQKRYWDVYK